MESPHEVPSQKRRKKKAYDGRPLAILRRIRGLTQQRLADATGIEARNIGKFERSESVPDEEQLGQIADALRVPVFVVEELRDMVSRVERFGEQSSLWSGRISAEGPQPEIVGEPDPFDPEDTTKQARRLKDSRTISRMQQAMGETLWRLMQGSDDSRG